MSERASYFKLGLFVIVGAAVTLAAVAILGAGAIFKQSITAETYMVESVQGLDVGAPVKHRGVPVGKVSRIGFLGEEYTLPTRNNDGSLNLLASYVYVEMELEVTRRGKDRDIGTYKSAVKGGLAARMASAGLVGNVYLDLYFPPDPPNPIQLSWEPRHLYLPSTKSVIAELTSTASRIAKQLEDAKLDLVAQNIDRLVQTVEKKVGEVDVAKFQTDTAAFIEELRASNKRVQEILANESIDETLRNIAATSESFRRITGEGEGDLAEFIKDLPEVSERLKSSAVEIESLLKDEKTRRIFDNVAITADLAPEAAAEVRRVAQRLGVLLSSQQSDLESIVRQLRKTTENLERLSEDAAKNPSRVIFGDPPPPTTPGSPETKK
jgi:ABC-type transporter Mla subunit MlaD